MDPGPSISVTEIPEREPFGYSFPLTKDPAWLPVITGGPRACHRPEALLHRLDGLSLGTVPSLFPCVFSTKKRERKESREADGEIRFHVCLPGYHGLLTPQTKSSR